MAKVRTRDEARQWLEAHGVSVAEFARRNEIPRDVVKELLIGRTRGLRGQSHRAAVLLGMKPAPVGQSPLKRP